MECPILLAYDTTENWKRNKTALGESELAIELETLPDGTTTKHLLVGDGTVQTDIDKLRAQIDFIEPLPRELDKIKLAIEEEARARKEADDKLEAEIRDEEAARKEADAKLAADIKAEEAARQQADEKLAADIKAEENARQQADNALLQAIAQEAQARQQAVNAEAQARQQADSSLAQSIAQEVQARQQADSSLLHTIAREAQARQQADNDQNQAVAAEAQARQQANSSLNQAIQALRSQIQNCCGGATPGGGDGGGGATPGGGDDGGGTIPGGDDDDGKTAGSEISPWAISLISKGGGTFTIADDAALVNDTGQEAEYALTTIDDTDLPDSQAWIRGDGGKVTWGGLSPETIYLVWARAKESVTHAAGPAINGGYVITDSVLYDGSEINPAWALSLISKGSQKIIIADDAALANNTGQEAEYALTSSVTLPNNQAWITGTGGKVAWMGLSPETVYYVWARAKESVTHAAGTAILGGSVTTDSVSQIGFDWEEFLEAFMIPSEVGKPFNPLYTDGPAHGKSGGAFQGGVLMPNNKVLLVPVHSDRLGIYDIATNTYTDGPLHGYGSGRGVFAGGVLMPNNKVLLVPSDSNRIGIYDIATNTFTFGPAHGKSGGAFQGGVLLPNNKVLLVPYNSANYGIYDIATDTYTDGPLHGHGSNNGAFRDGVLMPNNKVLLAPYNLAGNYILYDIATDTYTDGPAHVLGDQFRGSLLMPNNKVLLMPSAASKIGIYDIETNTLTYGPPYGLGNSNGTFQGGVFLPNNKVLFVPLYSNRIGIYDIETNTFTYGPLHGKGDGAFQGGVLMPNNKVLLVPFNSANIGIVSVPGLERNLAILMSPFINKF